MGKSRSQPLRGRCDRSEPLSSRFPRLRGRARAALEAPVRPRRGCGRDAGESDGENPGGFARIPQGRAQGRFNPQLRIRLRPLRRAEDLGDLRGGRGSINGDYWGISLSISCLRGEKSGRAVGHGGCTKTQQPPRQTTNEGLEKGGGKLSHREDTCLTQCGAEGANTHPWPSRSSPGLLELNLTPGLVGAACNSPSLRFLPHRHAEVSLLAQKLSGKFPTPESAAAEICFQPLLAQPDVVLWPQEGEPPPE